MRFGIKTRPHHTTWERMRDVWTTADELEIFESAWNWDHFYPLSEPFDGPNLDGWSTLAALAQATSRIRLGCQVTGMIYRHPAVLANIAATVDVISDGRLELGIGAGWNQQECDAYGIELPPLRERFDRFDEGVQALVGLLSQKSTTLDGQYVKLTDAWCEPKPVQRPHPPITIGGRGPKRTLRAAARWAQQWHTFSDDPEQWLALKDILLRHCEDVGRDPSEIICSLNFMVESVDQIDEAVRAAERFGRAGVDLAIMNLPVDATPDILEPLANALSSVS